jgi:5-methylcytosine-specific restriction endonuclease McrA
MYSQYPTTRKEAQDLKVTHYFTGLPCKHGHIALRKTKGTCMDCLRLEWAETNAKRALLPKSEASKKAGIKYYENNKELVKSKALGRSLEDRKRYRDKWSKDNPELRKANTKHRRTKHKQATPIWLTQEQKTAIKQFYLDAMVATRVTGTPYVVDHIIPLRGKLVSGLHVPWNLAVITREENHIKSNKLIDTTPK